MRSKKIIGLFLAASMLLCGCRTGEKTPVSSVVNTVAADAGTTVETSSETTKKQIEFNPHVYSEKLAERIPKDYWESFYNLCDALREGRTTFKCSSEEAYKWSTDTGVLANLFPAAGLKIEAKSDDGSPVFENGTGKIRYKIPAEEYVKLQKDFEKLIVDIMNEASVESDDTDYEKALKLYVYMAKNYSYKDQDDSNDENFVYHTFRTKEGICINFGSAYAYLLLQNNIDALNVGCYAENMDHAWTYAKIGGKYYHIDVTWALNTTYYGDEPLTVDNTKLDYFMMSDAERNADGCIVDDLTVQLLPEFWVKRTGLSFTAQDSSYNLRKDMIFCSLDEKNKTVRYTDGNNGQKEFHYEK